MKESPCYRCEQRHQGCHSSCSAYAAFSEARRTDPGNRVYPEGSGAYSGYVRRKKIEYMDKAAKKGWRRYNSQKSRYR